MSRKRHKPDEIVAKLRQVEVLTAQGRPVADAIRSIGGGELRDELLNREVVYPLQEAKIVIEGGRRHLQHPSAPLLARLRPAGPGGRAGAGPAHATRRRRPPAPRPPPPPAAPPRRPRGSCCGRLRSPDRLPRPPQPWRSDPLCTNSR